MLHDIRVGFVSASSSIKRGNKKTSIFIILVLGLIFLNLVFLPAIINGTMDLFVGFVQDYAYGDIVIEPAEDNPYIDNADNVLKKIRSVNGVIAATKRLEVGASLSHREKVVGATINGLVPLEEEGISKYPEVVVDGEFLGDLSRNEIMIGAMFVEGYVGSEIYDNLGEVKVGSLVNVTYSNGVERTYKVRGIHQGTWEGTDLSALVHYKELEDVFRDVAEGKASSIIVRIEKGEDGAEIKQKIIESGVKENVFTWQEKAEALVRQALQSISALQVMSKIVSLIVGAALIFIIIYINTLNRKKEIGILKAVGITPNSIRISYIFMSLFYVSMGIIIGLIMFLLLSIYLQANPLVFYETLKIAPLINVPDLIGNIFIMLGMAIIAGFIPAWFVTRLDILKAIWGR